MASLRSAFSRTGKRGPYSGGELDPRRADCEENLCRYSSEGDFLAGGFFGDCTMNGGLFGSARSCVQTAPQRSQR